MEKNVIFWDVYFVFKILRYYICAGKWFSLSKDVRSIPTELLFFFNDWVLGFSRIRLVLMMTDLKFEINRVKKMQL